MNKQAFERGFLKAAIDNRVHPATALSLLKHSGLLEDHPNLVGAGAGGLLGAGAGYMASDKPKDGQPDNRARNAALGGLGGAGVGAALMAALGGQKTPGVSPHNIHAKPTPTPPAEQLTGDVADMMDPNALTNDPAYNMAFGNAPQATAARADKGLMLKAMMHNLQGGGAPSEINEPLPGIGGALQQSADKGSQFMSQTSDGLSDIMSKLFGPKEKNPMKFNR